jgi:LysR family transcriptional regulator, regulator for metE and metH
MNKAMTLHHLNIIDTIVNQGSITAAAKKLFLTQPALSHQIKNIEKNTGIKVFHRLNKKLLLTEQGKRMLKTAVAVREELEKLENDLDIFRKNKTQRIRLATECYTCYHWLPSFVKKMQEEEPGIEYEMAVDSTSNPFKDLQNGKIEIAIFASTSQKINGLYSTKLFTDEMVLLVSPTHKLAKKRSISITEIAGENLFVYDIDENNNYVLKTIIGEKLSSLKAIKRIRLSEAIIEFVSSGLGVSIMAKWAITDYLRTGKVVSVKINDSSRIRNWNIASLQSNKTFVNKIAKSISLYAKNIAH